MEQFDHQCEKFRGGPTESPAERVHVTIKPDGSIFLNQKAHKMMGRPQAVNLYFNRQKEMIILEPTQAVSSPEAFLLRDAQHSARHVHASPFCKHFNIRVKTTTRFIRPTTDAAGRMYLKLSETVSVALGPRGSRVKR